MPCLGLLSSTLPELCGPASPKVREPVNKCVGKSVCVHAPGRSAPVCRAVSISSPPLTPFPLPPRPHPPAPARQQQSSNLPTAQHFLDYEKETLRQRQTRQTGLDILPLFHVFSVACPQACAMVLGTGGSSHVHVFLSLDQGEGQEFRK